MTESGQSSSSVEDCPNCGHALTRVDQKAGEWYRCTFDHCPVGLSNRGVTM